MKILEKLREKHSENKYRQSKRLGLGWGNYQSLIDPRRKWVKITNLIKIKQAYGLSWEVLGKELEEEYQEVIEDKPDRKLIEKKKLHDEVVAEVLKEIFGGKPPIT